MASLVLSGDTSGSITLAAPAVAGSTTQTLVNVTGTLAPIVSGTAVTLTNQTAPEFTSIPSWAKRITLMFSGVSTNGTALIQVQLGAGSYTTSGYVSGAQNGNNAPAFYSSGFAINSGSTAAWLISGQIIISSLGSNIWTYSSGFTASGSQITFGSGGIPLGGTLDRVRIIASATGSPSDQFDAGTINIIYE